MLAAPSAVVPVPTTVAPSFASACAIALPIPRVAPVTSATCAESDPIALPSSSTGSNGGERLFETRAIVERKCRHALVDASRETGQDLAGPAFDDMCDAAPRKGFDGFAPAHGTRCL